MVKTMKALFNTLVKVGQAFTKFFDRTFILPVSKLIHNISKKFDNSGRNFENWLSKQTTLLFISLFLAFAIFVTIDQKIIAFTESSAEVLKDQPVSAIYNEEAYIVEGIPETVDITMIGRRADLIFAKQSTNHDVKIDLTGLKPGTHKVNITYKQSMPSVEYSVNPSVATVVIYQKESVIKPLSVDVLNQDELSKELVVTKVEVSKNDVVVHGAAKDLEKVATVKALVDVTNLVDIKVGVLTLRDVPLVAYDNKGQIVNVEIVPSKIDATVTIASPKKEVPIKVIPTGELGFGSAISVIELSETRVTVFASEEVLKDLNFVEVKIDVTNLKDDREYKVDITKPAGVRTMSINNVKVNVKVGASTDREISGVNIEYRNLDAAYSVQGLTLEDIQVVVGLKGVKEVIESLGVEDVSAYLDLTDLGVGEHEVAVKVEGSDLRVNYIAKTMKVKIRIVKK